MIFHYLIVGGGSAGCVLAHRLSASPDTSVLLIEAGRDTPPDRVEPAILDSYPRIAYFNARNIWADLRVNFVSATNDYRTDPVARRYEQARLMGGGSSLNDMHANRGVPEDYAEWVERGAAGWSWQDVLPYFRRQERDMDFDGPLHGKDGPIPVRRIMPEVWPGFTSATAEAFKAAGYPLLLDQNAQFEDGHFPIAISNLYDRRVSTAIAYLDNTTRRRENLRILSNTTVEGLVFEGSRAVGVRANQQGQTQEYRAREVVVSAGAIHSPAILLRSGIGPSGPLKALGIEVVADRPGVGDNLNDHPTISVSALIAPQARLQKTLRRHVLLALRYSSGVEGCAPADMYITVACKSGWHPVGERIGSIVNSLNKPYSTGRVSLRTPRWADEPEVRFNMLSDHRDLERMRRGFRFAAGLFDNPALRQACLEVFPSSYSERVRDWGRVNNKNLVMTTLLAGLLDGPAALRRLLVRRVVSEGPTIQQLLHDDLLLDDFLRANVHGVWHASGTCRMGAAGDPHAVVDPAGRVYGVAGLRVVDASVMPCVPRANTNFPTIMIAEKMSDAMLKDRVVSHSGVSDAA